MAQPEKPANLQFDLGLFMIYYRQETLEKCRLKICRYNRWRKFESKKMLKTIFIGYEFGTVELFLEKGGARVTRI